MPQALAHDVNPATDRCVRCGRNRFNRDQQPYCMTTGDYVQKWQEEAEVRRESASASPAPPSCSACGGDTANRLVCTKCYSVVGGFEKPPLSESDLARIAVRHFPVKLESQLGIVKKDVNAEGRAACLVALREACGMGGKA